MASRFMPSVEDEGDIDVDNIAFLQGFCVGDPVADHVIDRGARRLGKAAVVQGRRDSPVRQGELDYQVVEPFGGNTRLNVRHKHACQRSLSRSPPPSPALPSRYDALRTEIWQYAP